MARRKKSSNPCDLFAFQDIISATIGILLLITCLFSLLKPAAQAIEQVEESIDQPAVTAIASTPSTEDPNLAIMRELQTELRQRQEALQQVKATEQELAGYIQAEIDRIKVAPVTQGVSYTMTGSESIDNYRIILAEGKDAFIYSPHRDRVDAVIRINAFTWMNAQPYLGDKPKIIILVKPSALERENYLLSMLMLTPRDNARYEYVSEDTDIVP